MYQITIEAEYNMKNVSLSILRNFVVKCYFVYDECVNTHHFCHI